MIATEMCLVVLAAGRGKRFGGSKQLVAVRDDGSTITDILLCRAAAAGIERAAIVVNADIESDVRAHVAAVSPDVRVDLVIQRRPRGTADAVLAARDAVTGPIVVVNADDLYPASAFGVIAAHLRNGPAHEHAAVGFRLDRTRVGPRPESRALLDVDASGLLTAVREAQIELRGDGTFARSGGLDVLAAEQLVSMNMWGFRTNVFDALEAVVADRDRRGVEGEVFLPDVVASMVAVGATVRVVRSDETCVGLTYADDVETVRSVL
jgi:bifunctional N-acetylglucosamine-1-phosphate-uridyltransferase/glucosamine-1-phosphate-acetyltransferase GlmU-like protein